MRGKIAFKMNLLFVLIALVLAGCSAPAPVASPTPAPSANPLPSPTPSPTVTPAPSNTPAPTLAPTVDFLELTLPKGPTLIYTGSNTAMRVFWQWGETSTFKIEWGTDESYSSGNADVGEYDVDNHLYAFDFHDLQPGSRYLYRISLNLSAVTGSFTAAPAADTRTLKFISYGDTRTNPDQHDAVAKQIVHLFQGDPAYQTFNLFVGDFVTSGDLEESWQNEFFNPAWKYIREEVANLAFLPVMGNHEGGGQLYTRYFPLPFVRARYTSFDYGPAHIALVDQYVPYGPGSNQLAWLETDLAASSKPWKFVVLHEPGWSAGGGHDNNVEVQVLQPLFERTGVAIVFGGHNHYYARAEVNGVIHLTAGTGGAPLYSPVESMPHIAVAIANLGYTRFEINGDILTGQFVGLDGSILDQFTISKK
jgi:hypothetical protein